MTRNEEMKRAIARINELHNLYEEEAWPEDWETTRFVLDVLLLEQSREVGCDVCRGVKILHGTFSGTIPVDSETQMEVESDGDVDFSYCPCCGRMLSDAAHGMTNLDSLLEEIANTRIKSAFYKYQKRMVFVGDFAGEAETRKEAIEREINWLQEEKKND